ncbi:hypothetical protein PENSPDRAFT_685215 [Peniophora sp. CONT]|nr:hypothetical protein PENSPDRAFT_685215 [Peniophora sp. CONT]
MPCLLSGWKPSPGTVYCFVDHPASAVSRTSIVPAAANVKSPAALPRRGEPGHIKRPRNGFIIFRCDFVARNRGKTTRAKSGDRTKRLSHQAGDAWKKLSAAQRDVYMTLAALEKDEHARRHPDYVYRPNKQRNGRQPSTPKRAYRPAPTLVERHTSRVAPTTVDMPAIGSLSIAGPSADIMPAASPSYSAVESMYSPSSSRSTPFVYEATSPSTDSDYPQTPHSEYATTVYDTGSKDAVNAYTYSYQTTATHLPVNHLYTETTGLYVASPPTPSYTYGPVEEPSTFAESSYSTLANWAGELDAPAAPPTSSTTYVAPVMPVAPSPEVSGYSQPAFGSEVIDFDAYVYSEPVSVSSYL